MKFFVAWCMLEIWVVRFAAATGLTQQVKTFGCPANDFPQWIIFNDTISNLQSGFEISSSCRVRVSAVQISNEYESDFPNFQMKINDLDVILHKTEIGSKFTTYEVRYDEVDLAVGENFLIFPDVKNLVDVNAFLEIRVKINSINILSTNWTDSTECIPLNGVSGEGVEYRLRHCFDIFTKQFVEQESCEDEEYLLTQCVLEPYWKEKTEWSKCLTFNSTLCGSGSQWAMAVNCFDNVTQKPLDQQKCGPSIFYDRECYVSYSGNTTWSDDDWILSEHCAIYLPEMQKNNDNTQYCGNGLETYSAQCLRNNSDGITIEHRISSEYNGTRAPINIISCYIPCGGIESWGTWGNWSECDQDCSNSTASSTRDCNGTYHRTRDCYKNGNLQVKVERKYCVGKFIEYDFCKWLDLYKWKTESGSFGSCIPLNESVSCGNGIKYKYPDECYYNTTTRETSYPHLCGTPSVHARDCFKVCNDTCNQAGGIWSSASHQISNSNVPVEISPSNYALQDRSYILMYLKADWTGASVLGNNSVVLSTLKSWDLYENFTSFIPSTANTPLRLFNEARLVVNGSMIVSIMDGGPSLITFFGCSMPQWSMEWVRKSCNATCDGGREVNGTEVLSQQCVWVGTDGTNNGSLADHYCRGEPLQQNSTCQPSKVCFEYSNYTEWSNCTDGLCGNFGRKSRTRECMGMSLGEIKKYPAENCTDLGSPIEFKPCYNYQNICITWSEWGNWSEPEVCGNFTLNRTRKCFSDYSLYSSDSSADELHLFSTLLNNISLVQANADLCYNTTYNMSFTDFNTAYKPCLKKYFSARPETAWRPADNNECMTYFENTTHTEGGVVDSGIDCYNVTAYEDLGCQHECGNTSKLFVRNCTYYNGSFVDYSFCSHYKGSQNYSENCTQQPCFNVTAYEDLGCQHECGNTSRLFVRNCTYYNGSFVDYSFCSHYEGPQNYSKNCTQKPCFGYGSWSSWNEDCTQSCGGGLQLRSRSCYLSERNLCDGLTEERVCNTHPCPVNGYWLEWSQMTPCSVSCGVGEQVKTREYVPPHHGGADVANYSGETTETFSQPCENVKACPGLLLAHLSCSVACSANDLECLPVVASSNSTKMFEDANINCSTSSHITESHRHNKYDPSYDTVKEICNVGNNTYDCDAEPPENIVRLCNCGDPDELSAGSWSNWGECSSTCGQGTRSRSRKFQHMHTGVQDDVRKCKVQDCPVDGDWSMWSGFSSCSKTCGPGKRTRTRHCDSPAPINGGRDCYGIRVEEMDCSMSFICPIHGGWSEWSNESACDQPCGGGWKRKYRKCNKPIPEFNGNPCDGESVEKTQCNSIDCMPVRANFYLEFVDEPFDEKYADVTDSDTKELLKAKIRREIDKVYNNNDGHTKVQFKIEFHEFKEGTGEGIKTKADQK